MFPMYHAAQKAVSEPLVKYVLSFLYTYGTYFALIVIITFILGRFFGHKTIWFIAFILWPIGVSLFNIMESLLFYMNEYPDGIPEWVTNYVFNSIFAYLIISPFLAWGGLLLGSKKYKNKIKA